MNFNYQRHYPNLKLCLALLLGLLIGLAIQIHQPQPVAAQHPNSTEAERINNRIDINQLRRDVQRLNQPSRTNRPTNINGVTVPTTRERINPPVDTSDSMFERLATLVIELKERVQALEAKVAQLENSP